MSSFAASSSAVFAAGNVMRRRNTDDALKRRKSHRRRSVATRAAALQDEEATKPQPEPKNWEYKYLYDGACPVCRSLKAGLEGEDAFSERKRALYLFLLFSRARKSRALISGRLFCKSLYLSILSLYTCTRNKTDVSFFFFQARAKAKAKSIT